MDCYRFDQLLSSENLSRDTSLPGLALSLNPSLVIAGVDEAGRGPLAGPVVVAAVILPSSPRIEGLRDSKVVPPEQREALFCEIQEEAIAFAIAIIEPIEIDAINIFQATMKAMRQALLELAVKPHLAAIDGNQLPKSGLREKAIVKGDGKSAAIMAASILAKVTRDHIMFDAHERYPHYGFNSHKGYGCRQHFEAIRQFGPCDIHRASFSPIKEIKLGLSPVLEEFETPLLED